MVGLSPGVGITAVDVYPSCPIHPYPAAALIANALAAIRVFTTGGIDFL